MEVTKAGWNTTLVPTDTPSACADVRVIDVTTIDRLVASRPHLPPVKLLKTDAEGYDLRIIRGSKAVIQSAKPVLHFEYNLENIQDLNEAGFEIFAFLQDKGYRHLAIWDAFGRFILGTTFDQADLIRDLHDYSDASLSPVVYYDFCAFHQDDDDVATAFMKQERAHRAKLSQTAKAGA